MNKMIQYILALVALLSSVFGVYFYIDNRYALAEELNQVKQRLEYKIQEDQLSAIQERIWKIEDRFTNKPMDVTTKEELNKLKEQKENLKNRLKNIDNFKK